MAGCQGGPRDRGAPIAAAAVSEAGAAAPNIRRTLLASQDLTDRPGFELRLYLVEYAPGAAADPHMHPVAGVGYVLDGSFESAFGADSPTITRQGESFADRTQEVHRLFRNTSATSPLRFLMAYAVAKGAPVVLSVPQNSGKDASMNNINARAAVVPPPQPADSNVAKPSSPTGIRRKVLGVQPIADLPDWELRVLLIEYDGGVAADPHSHPVPGIGYVLDGAFESAWGQGQGGEVTVVRRGESFVDLANERHLFRNASPSEPLRFIITYAIRKGAPTLVPA